MQVAVVGHTKFLPINAMITTGGQWGVDDYEEDINQGGHIAEFAGRGCYGSWNKPNPATATNEGYLNHIFDVGHLSVIEHGTVSLHFADVSRSFTHELIRHRHFSFSQLSQRYARIDLTADAGKHVVPPLLQGDPTAEAWLLDAWRAAVNYYEKILPEAQRVAKERGYTGTMAKKRAMEAARAVLPNMTPTKIVVSGNHRSWVEFLLKRGGETADLEIREAAFQVYTMLRALEPSIYGKIEFVAGDPDGYLRVKT